MNLGEAAARGPDISPRAAARGEPRVWGAVSPLSLLLTFCGLLVLVSVWTLGTEDELSMGRKPWQNLKKTVVEMSEPSFLRVWFGDTNSQVRDQDGKLLRVDDQRATERRYLAGVGRALWTTLRIATLGTVLAALIALPLGLLAARTLHAPRVLFWSAKGVLDVLRSIHTLVFGLFLVGIVGLGATAGILAVALHSSGTLGKLLAEAIESLDDKPVDAVRATGATGAQVFFLGVWPAVLPHYVSQVLYVWEFNIRDSTILGLVGAGGLGLLLSEAMSLFQWGRLATLLLAIVIMVTAFDSVSRAVRARLV